MQWTDFLASLSAPPSPSADDQGGAAWEAAAAIGDGHALKCSGDCIKVVAGWMDSLSWNVGLFKSAPLCRIASIATDCRV